MVRLLAALAVLGLGFDVHAQSRCNKGSAGSGMQQAFASPGMPRTQVGMGNPFMQPRVLTPLMRQPGTMNPYYQQQLMLNQYKQQQAMLTLYNYQRAVLEAANSQASSFGSSYVR